MHAHTPTHHTCTWTCFHVHVGEYKQLYMCMLVHTFLPSIMCTVNKLDTASYRNKETHRPSSSALGPPQSGPQVPWKQSLFISVGGVQGRIQGGFVGFGRTPLRLIYLLATQTLATVPFLGQLLLRAELILGCKLLKTPNKPNSGVLKLTRHWLIRNTNHVT